MAKGDSFIKALTTNRWVKTVSIVGTALGIISSIISIITISNNQLNPYYIIPLALIIILCGVLLFLIPKNNMPMGVDEITDEIGNPNIKRQIKVVFPCDDREYDAANKLAKEKFGKNSVSNRVINDWKRRNEFILTCLYDSNRMVGYFDILPLTSIAALQLIKGEIKESEISSKHILSVHEMKDAEYIYVAGIAIKDTDSGKGFIQSAYLICAAILYTQLFYKNSKLKKVITIPTSDCGLKIVKNLKFTLEREGTLRKDGYDIYAKDYDYNSISTLIAEKNAFFTRFDSNSYKETLDKIYI